MRKKTQVYLNSKWVPHKQWGAEKLYYFSHWLWERNWKKLAYIIKYINMIVFRNFIPPEVEIGARLDLPHGGFGVVMHKDTEIGNDAIILHNVTIADGGVRIGNKVYIGTGTTILGPVKIGNDVTIGANTFINFNIPSNKIVVGHKGKIIVE